MSYDQTIDLLRGLLTAASPLLVFLCAYSRRRPATPMAFEGPNQARLRFALRWP
jgi:hypothetical protein